jgi:hypothetical protein
VFEVLEEYILIMSFFTGTHSYYFVGPTDLIENNKHIENNERKVYLGKFIRYIGLPYVSDWIHDAKAVFEYGTISNGYYDSVRAIPC